MGTGGGGPEGSISGTGGGVGCLVGSKSGGSDEDARQGERVEQGVLSAVLDPGVVLNAHDVAGRVVGDGKPGEGEEPGKEEKVA